MKRSSLRNILCIGVATAILVGLSGCGGKTTPSGASFIFGSLIVPEGVGGSFTVLQWKEGLTVVLVDDIEGEHTSSGSGSTEDSTWRGQGSARAADGRQVSWRVETTEGKTAAIVINEQKYDLEQGTLFFIRTSGGQTSVVQNKRNPIRRCSDYEECHLLLKNDSMVMQFIQETLGSR